MEPSSIIPPKVIEAPKFMFCGLLVRIFKLPSVKPLVTTFCATISNFAVGLISPIPILPFGFIRKASVPVTHPPKLHP